MVFPIADQKSCFKAWILNPIMVDSLSYSDIYLLSAWYDYQHIHKFDLMLNWQLCTERIGFYVPHLPFHAAFEAI